MSTPLALHPSEPPAGPWRVERFDAVVDRLLRWAEPPIGRPWVIAVDGRSASGKSTLAARFAGRRPGAVVIHTDDVAWHHAIMGWADLLAEGVLEPVHRGQPVHYRPPAWDVRDRAGAIVVPDGTDLVVVEGVGASRRELSRWYDATVWVQSDREVAYARGIARDGDDQATIDFWEVWAAEEDPFFDADRPWERADLIICSTPTLDHDPVVQVVVGVTMHQAGSPAD